MHNKEALQEPTFKECDEVIKKRLKLNKTAGADCT